MKHSKIPRPSSALQSATSKSDGEGVCLALLKDGVGLAVVDFTSEEFASIQSNSAKTGQSLGDALLKTAEAMVSTNAPKISRGFVLVNLSEREKEELRDLAHKSGIPLRDAMRFALREVRAYLTTSARVTQLTGLGGPDQCRFFNYGQRLNAN